MTGPCRPHAATADHFTESRHNIDRTRPPHPCYQHQPIPKAKEGAGTCRLHLFRHLGRHPGPDTDPHAAAALLGIDPDTAERQLQYLVDHSLLIESPVGRYRMHDLVRAQARTLTITDPEYEHGAALDRLLRYWLRRPELAPSLTSA